MRKKSVLYYSVLLLILSACSNVEETAAQYLAETYEAKHAMETEVVLSFTPTPPEPTLTPTFTVTPSPIPSLTPTITPTPIEPIGLINQESAAVYSGPGSEYKKLGVLSADNQVDLIGLSEDGYWFIISYLHLEEAWIPLDYVDTLYDFSTLRTVDTPPVPIKYYTLSIINSTYQNNKKTNIEVWLSNLDTGEKTIYKDNASVSLSLVEGDYRVEVFWRDPTSKTKNPYGGGYFPKNIYKNFVFYLDKHTTLSVP